MSFMKRKHNVSRNCIKTNKNTTKQVEEAEYAALKMRGACIEIVE